MDQKSPTSDQKGSADLKNQLKLASNQINILQEENQNLKTCLKMNSGMNVANPGLS